MATSIISSPTVIQKLSMISYSMSWVGSPVGTASVQVSNDYTQNSDGSVMNPGTWNTLTLDYLGTPVQSIPITGANGSAFIDVDATGAYAMRLVYTATSGAATLQAIIHAKVS
jgi:hypothetical protein